MDQRLPASPFCLASNTAYSVLGFNHCPRVHSPGPNLELLFHNRHLSVALLPFPSTSAAASHFRSLSQGLPLLVFLCYLLCAALSLSNCSQTRPSNTAGVFCDDRR